jgi:hypothetical protein
MVSLLKIASLLVEDALRSVLLLFRSAEAPARRESLLRWQLALHIERGIPPCRVGAATRISLALLARLFDWRGASVVMQPRARAGGCPPAAFSLHPFDPLGARWTWLERIAEILRLPDHLAALEFHDAHDVDG